MSKAVSFFTEKDDKKSLQAMIQQQVKKTIEKANALEVDNKDAFDETLGNEVYILGHTGCSNSI